MFTLKFTTGIRPTERNMQLARAAQIYYHQGAYSDDKPEQKVDQAGLPDIRTSDDTNKTGMKGLQFIFL